MAVKQFTKYIPLVGQLIAASLGFAIVKMVGDNYINDCHSLAEAILKEELKYSKKV